MNSFCSPRSISRLRSLGVTLLFFVCSALCQTAIASKTSVSESTEPKPKAEQDSYYEMEIERLAGIREAEKAKALAPIQTRFELAGKELLRKAMLSGDLEAAQALQSMLETQTPAEDGKTPLEKEMLSLLERRDKEIALAVNPIQKRYDLATQQLVRKALQKGDLEAAIKLKAMIETGGVTALSVDKNMVSVESGTLPSGSGLAGQVVASFEIGKYEVTWGEWQKVRDWAAAQGYDLKEVGQGHSENHPVTHVNWWDVVKWCNARSEQEGKTPVYIVSGTTYKKGEISPNVSESANGYRLPSEKEWEWAARGGINSEGYTYAGSNDFNTVGWVKGNSGGKTHPVGKKRPNELGIYDMSGNVDEWCWDKREKISRWQLRGGDWFNLATASTVSFRDFSHERDRRYETLGFRLARSSGN